MNFLLLFVKIHCEMCTRLLNEVCSKCKISLDRNIDNKSDSFLKMKAVAHQQQKQVSGNNLKSIKKKKQKKKYSGITKYYEEHSQLKSHKTI